MPFSKLLLTFATLIAAIPVMAAEPHVAPYATVDPAISFPDPARATRKKGAFIAPADLNLVGPGMTKGQLYTLLDVPHFHEGLFGSRRWNYILNFYSGTGRDYMQCQYQIQFDKHARVSGAYWRGQRCADLFAALLARPVPLTVAAAPAPVPVAEVAAKSYQVTFDFDQSDIRPDDEKVLASVAAELRQHLYRKIVVTGFADTTGSADYNDALGARRASNVSLALRKLLEADSGIQIYSRSGRDLAVQTGDQVREERNRRVSIDLIEG